MNEEVLRQFRAAVTREIFGDEWRPERPLAGVGGLMGPILSGRVVQDVAEYNHRVGKISGLIEAVDLLAQAVDSANEPGTRSADA